MSLGTSRSRRSMAVLLLILPALPVASQSEKKAEPEKKTQPEKKKRKKGRASIVNDAYRAIKERRRDIVDKYVTALFAISEECVEKKLERPGMDLTEKILKIVELPKNRRKVRVKSAGVGLDKKGELEVRKMDEAEQKPADPAELERIESVRKRVAELRGKLKGGPADGQSPDPKPLDLGKDEDEEEKKQEEKQKQKPAHKSSSKGRTAVPKKEEGASEAPAVEPAAPQLKRLENDMYGKEASARKAAMKKVESLAKSCVKQGFPAHGYELLLWAIQFDPDNEDLRKIVRQHAYTGKDGKKRWYGPYELGKAKAGYIDHPEYGWVTPAEVKAIQSGKLWYQNQWQPRDLVEVQRQKWENRWTHQTEHYEIETNAPLRDAVEFGREVERLYSFFFRMFYDFYSVGNANNDMKLVFGGGKDLGQKKLKLNYYRSREHFLSEVKKDKDTGKLPPGEIALLEQSAGFYWGQTGRAYFYRGPDGPDLSTIYHEVTHQIFGETYEAGPRANTWLVEGFGVFMEDPLIRGERLIAGAERPPGVRAANARDINEFVKNYQSHEGFHSGPRGDNYATAGALVHFFLFYKGGIYRQAFMRYAREAYRNVQDDSPTPISKLYEYLGISQEQFQEDWEEFNNNPDLFDF